MPRIPTSFRVALFSALLALASNLAVIAFIHWHTSDDVVAALRQQVTEEAAVLDDLYARAGGPRSTARSAMHGTIRNCSPR